jgi:hypothetical protein
LWDLRNSQILRDVQIILQKLREVIKLIRVDQGQHNHRIEDHKGPECSQTNPPKFKAHLKQDIEHQKQSHIGDLKQRDRVPHEVIAKQSQSCNPRPNPNNDHVECLIPMPSHAAGKHIDQILDGTSIGLRVCVQLSPFPQFILLEHDPLGIQKCYCQERLSAQFLHWIFWNFRDSNLVEIDVQYLRIVGLIM